MTDISTHFDQYSDDDDVPKHATTVTVHPSVTIIRNSAFQNCSELTSVIISDSVTEIRDYAFYQCSQLGSVDIPNSVKEIRNGAFADCPQLTSIKIPESVTSIEDGTFNRCSKLMTINIPNSVTRFRSCAFEDCSQLTSIVIPNSVTSIDNLAFYECSQLRSVNIPDSVTSIGNGTFGKCSKLTSITMSNSVKSIGNGAFSFCSQLTSVIIPNSVEDIGWNTSQKCSIMSIGCCAFDGCQALKQRLISGNNYNPNIHTWLRQRFVNLPLHQTFYNTINTMTTRTITKLIQQHKSTLIATDAMGMTPLHVLCCNPTSTTELIKLLKTAQPDTTSMRNVLGQTPLVMLLELRAIQYNDYHDEDGRLIPLVDILYVGLEYKALNAMLALDGERRFQSEVELTDKSSGLLPFMYAASLSRCSLDVVYELAMLVRPDLLYKNGWNTNNSTFHHATPCNVSNGVKRKKIE